MGSRRGEVQRIATTPAPSDLTSKDLEHVIGYLRHVRRHAARGVPDAADIDELEKAFIRVGRALSKERGISRSAFLIFGVAPDVVAAAGIV